MDDSVKRQLELTHRQARRAARIVQNLLEFSRPASPQKKPIDLNSVIERTIQLQEHSLRRNNVAVEFHPQPDLPQVVGDGNQLIQVFLNLLTNAEQAIREVRDQGIIHVRIVNHLTRIAVIVQDDGVGIRPEALPRIFDPFYTSKRPGGGTGLGLSISTSIVREHGGSLEADVVPAGGSMFTVYLPVVAAALQVAPAASGDAPALDTPGPGNEAQVGRSILVLDDEESIRLLLEEGLSARGLRVDCAANVDAALALVARRPYDVLLCDLNIKSANTTEDGHSAADRVTAASGANPPFVIFMTGDFAESASRAADGRLIRCLQKPFRISDVIALLGEISFPTPAGHRKP